MSDKRLARNTDPKSSHDAAKSIVPTRKEKHSVIIKLLTAKPGLTSREIAFYIKVNPEVPLRIKKVMDYYEVARRVGEIADRGEPRKCTRKPAKRKVCTWYVDKSKEA